ncbi:MAG: aminoglycoside phosphotransferase family protein [Methylomonas sp.]|nr:aminoglycoside phosphotransferase family protein [Methylomonas sp.]
MIKPLGHGLINDTYLIEAPTDTFVLQRINTHVFPRPHEVMDNLAVLGRHIRQKSSDSAGLRIPNILPTRQGEAFYRDEQQDIWRALERIHPAESRESINHPDEAVQTGFALAQFHGLCADLPPTLLHDTLPGFHVTPAHLEQYDRLMAQGIAVEIDGEFRKCQAFIESRRQQAHVLENARNCGELTERVIHGDPKLNNFLFQPGSYRIVSLIDLDTVKPGLVHYDIGDCIRSCCHDKETGGFDLDRCSNILESYLSEAGKFFVSSDYDYLYDAIRLIPFELGLRFFTDYLSGNRYFKTSEPRQNLNRALAQLALCADIERQQAYLRQCIADLKIKQSAARY